MYTHKNTAKSKCERMERVTIPTTEQPTATTTATATTTTTEQQRQQQQVSFSNTININQTDDDDYDAVDNTNFRSILPHEPPFWLLPLSSSSSLPSPANSSSTISTPPNGEDDPDTVRRWNGYLHIQGAFTPKLLPPRHEEEDDKEVEEVHKEPESTITNTTTTTTTTTTATNIGTTGSSTISTLDFWTQHRTTFEYLLLLQFRYFHQTYIDGGSGNSCSNEEQQQQQPQSLQLLDAVPPYTKVRLRFTTPPLAHVALQHYRNHKITVRQMLQLPPPPPPQHYDHNRNDTDTATANMDDRILRATQLLRSILLLPESQSSSSASLGEQPVVVGMPDRWLQITEITNRPLLHTSTENINTDEKNDEEMNHHRKNNNNISNICWTKSNPPKFRRLIARPYENIHTMERHRQTTRFIVITNLLPSSPSVASNNTTATAIANALDHTNITSGNQQQPLQQQDVHSIWENDPISIAQAIRSTFNQYDTSRGKYGIEVFVPSQINKRTRYCHVGMRSAIDAQTVVKALQETIVQWSWRMGGNDVDTTDKARNDTTGSSIRTITSGKLFLDYADITQRSMTSTILSNSTDISLSNALNASTSLLLGHPSRPQCTSTTDDIHIPGLMIIPDYIRPDEEEVLMAILTGPQAPWAPTQKTASYENGVVRRLVQHYGYVFDYQTANVLRDRSTIPNANCPPMPAMNPLSLLLRHEGPTTVSSSVSPDDHMHLPTTTGIPSQSSLLDDYVTKCINEGRGWEVLAGIIGRTRRYQFVEQTSDNTNGENPLGNTTTTTTFPFLNQLTVNHYKPGEGIGSHVDTPSAFADGLISISLNGGTVMEFRNVQDLKQRKKLVYLPPRSMLLMSKEARYEWEHMIVTRMTDTYNDTVLPRKLRVSLTLRTALAEDGTSYLPLVESNHYPPVWGESYPKSLSSSKSTMIRATNELATPACERDHVHKVYDAIATQWHHTRGKRGVLWPGATQFLQRLSPGSIVADVGCGDGKYFPAIWEAGSFVIGSDISEPLLRTAIHDDTCDGDIPENCRVSDRRQHLRNYPAVLVADCMNVPLRTSSCDAAICIAVLHHLSTLARRKRCIEELVRIVKPGGMVNVQAWALEQEDGSRRKFASNDVFVPFNAQPKYLKLNGSSVDGKMNGSDASPGIKSTAQVYSEALNAEYDEGKGLVVFQRYCHLYRLGELEEIVADVPGAAVIDRGFESGNYFIVFQVQK